MTNPAIHVVFGPSAAVTLRQALIKAGREERVVCPYDDLNVGPINLHDENARTRWFDEELGLADWEEITACNEPFLAASLSIDVRPVAWISRRDARCYTGFLWWLSHLDGAPCEIIDVTEHMTVRQGPGGRPRPPELVVSPSLLLPGEMADLLDRKMFLTAAAHRQYLDLWQRLLAENAPLRILDKTGLTSAPITFFDPLILSCAATTWQVMARVVGEALARSREGNVYQTGDLFLAARVCALAGAGAFEWRGNISSVHSCEVRLPVRDRQ